MNACFPRRVDCTHRPPSISFLGLPFRIPTINHKKELCRGLFHGHVHSRALAASVGSTDALKRADLSNYLPQVLAILGTWAAGRTAAHPLPRDSNIPEVLIPILQLSECFLSCSGLVFEHAERDHP